MKGVWDTLRRCHDDVTEEDCFEYWWEDWVGENNCCNCGKGTVEIKLHTEYPILGWKEGGVVGKEGDEIRSSVRITFPYFECPECGLSYTNWMHEEIDQESREKHDSLWNTRSSEHAIATWNATQENIKKKAKKLKT